MCKVELLPELHSPVNELGPFNPAVLVHGHLLMQSMTKVFSSDYPWQVLAIKLYRRRIDHMLKSSAEVNTLGFGLSWVWISRKYQVMLFSILLADLKHSLKN